MSPNSVHSFLPFFSIWSAGAPWRLTQLLTQRLRRTIQTLSSCLTVETGKKVHRRSNNRCAVCASILRRVLSILRSCGFGSMADDQKPMKFRSREMDLCHRRLLRADAILVLKGKPYAHLGAANCPAAIPLRSGKKCSESGLEKTQPEPGESMSLIMIMLIIANFIECGL